MLFSLLFVIAAAAGEPPSVADAVIAEFLMITADLSDPSGRWSDLHEKLRAAQIERLRHEPKRATEYPLRPWRQTLGQRVDELAARMVGILREPAVPATAVERTARAVAVIADLALALAKNAGGRAGYMPPLGAGAAALGAGAVAAVGGLDLEVAYVLLAGGVLSGMAGVALDLPKWWAAPSAQRRAMTIARSMADVFWNRVEWHWSPTARASHDPELISGRVHDRLGIDDATLGAACELWLTNRPAPRT